MRGTNAHRDRTYKFAGIESKIQTELETGSIKHEIDTGVRYHVDMASVQLLNGPRTPDFLYYPNGVGNAPVNVLESKTSLANSGELRDDEHRSAKAISVYLQDRIRITDSFAVIPGVRYESFSQTRTINRSRRDFNEGSFDYALGTNPTTQVDRSGTTINQIVLPGMGTTYEFYRDITWFTRIHRGFSPPGMNQQFHRQRKI